MCCSMHIGGGIIRSSINFIVSIVQQGIFNVLCELVNGNAHESGHSL